MTDTPTTLQERDIHFMRRCLQLAQCGQLSCAPNPMVGAVVVSADGCILGEGYHIRAGEGHAEVNALNSVKREDWPLLKDATIYVSLEPCAHYGRTPPCAELIVRKGLKRCVIGCQDPFSKVSGRGIEILQQAGIEVTVGVLREECLQLNKQFICCQMLGRPFITLKWAQQVVEGDDATDRIIGVEGERLYVSTPISQMHGHRLRAQHQAILVGHGTLLADHPRLDVRHWAHGNHRPMCYVLGRVGEDELPRGWQAFADIDSILEDMHRHGLQSLLVEGGQQVLQSFIERDLWDEVWVEDNLQPAERTPFSIMVAAPHMPENFQPVAEQHFGARFLHWQSPLLKAHYVDWK